MKIKNFVLKRYLDGWLYNVGFANDYDVELTLIRAMSNEQSLKDWGIFGMDYDEKFAIKFLEDMLDKEDQEDERAAQEANPYEADYLMADPLTFDIYKLIEGVKIIQGERNKSDAVYDDDDCDTIKSDRNQSLQAGLTCDRLIEGASKMSNERLQQLFNPNRLMDRLFKKVENVVWDMTTGNIAVATKDGIVGIEITEVDDGAGGKTKQFQTVENPFTDMGMAIPAFAQQTNIEAVKEGDLVVRGTMIGWVTKINKMSVSVIKPDGAHTTFTPPKTVMLDFGSGLMVVRSLFNMLPGGTAGVNNMQSMLMPMMMMGGLEGEGMEKMIPMMLMMNGATTTSGDPAAAAAAPMMGNMQQMMPMMMMMSMMKGNKSPFGGSNDAPGFRR